LRTLGFAIFLSGVSISCGADLEIPLTAFAKGEKEEKERFGVP
jgi:hypothetical protein